MLLWFLECILYCWICRMKFEKHDYHNYSMDKIKQYHFFTFCQQGNRVISHGVWSTFFLIYFEHSASDFTQGFSTRDCRNSSGFLTHSKPTVSRWLLHWCSVHSHTTNLAVSDTSLWLWAAHSTWMWMLLENKHQIKAVCKRVQSHVSSCFPSLIIIR